MKNETAKITDSIFIWYVDVLGWKEKRWHFTNHYTTKNSGRGIQDSLSDTVISPFCVPHDHDLMWYSHEHCRLVSLHISFMDAQAHPLMLNICLVPLNAQFDHILRWWCFFFNSMQSLFPIHHSTTCTMATKLLWKISTLTSLFSTTQTTLPTKYGTSVNLTCYSLWLIRPYWPNMESQ